METMKNAKANIDRQLATEILSPAMVCIADPVLRKKKIQQLRECRATIEGTLTRALEGIPLSASNENMDFQNALQVGQAREYLICQEADFDLARRFMAEHPESKGRRIFVS